MTKTFNISKNNLLNSIYFFMWLFPGILHADVIFLKNGKRIEGRLTGQNLHQVTLQTADGSLLLSKKEIRQISYGITSDEIKKTEQNLNKLSEAKKKQMEIYKKKNAEQARKIKEVVLELEKTVIDEQKTQEEDLKKRKLLAETINAEISKIEKNRKDIKDEIRQLKAEEKKLAHEQAELMRKRRQALGEPEPESEIILTDEMMRNRAFLRSALVPGWGQYYRDRKISGSAVFAGTLMGIAAAFSAKKSYDIARSDYDSILFVSAMLTPGPSSLPPAMLLYSKVLDARSRINSSGGRYSGATAFIAGIYIFNLIDVFFQSPAKIIDEDALSRKNRGLRFSLNPIPSRTGKNPHEITAEFSYSMEFDHAY